jgi:hypothetical protein
MNYKTEQQQPMRHLLPLLYRPITYQQDGELKILEQRTFEFRP